jgi:hypothetical protein
MGRWGELPERRRGRGLFLRSLRANCARNVSVLLARIATACPIGMSVRVTEHLGRHECRMSQICCLDRCLLRFFRSRSPTRGEHRRSRRLGNGSGSDGTQARATHQRDRPTVRMGSHGDPQRCGAACRQTSGAFFVSFRGGWRIDVAENGDGFAIRQRLGNPFPAFAASAAADLIAPPR